MPNDSAMFTVECDKCKNIVVLNCLCSQGTSPTNIHDMRIHYCVTLQLGDVFADRYVVVKKLGWGHFSTVWMARDDRRTNSTAPKV